jgi:hypothetical protein
MIVSFLCSQVVTSNLVIRSPLFLDVFGIENFHSIEFALRSFGNEILSTDAVVRISLQYLDSSVSDDLAWSEEYSWSLNEMLSERCRKNLKTCSLYPVSNQFECKGASMANGILSKLASLLIVGRQYPIFRSGSIVPPRNCSCS